jgi:hypothetical protein
MGFKIIALRSLEWHHMSAKIHKVYQLVQKLIGGQTDTQTGWRSHKPISIFGK